MKTIRQLLSTFLDNFENAAVEDDKLKQTVYHDTLFLLNRFNNIQLSENSRYEYERFKARINIWTKLYEKMETKNYWENSFIKLLNDISKRFKKTFWIEQMLERDKCNQKEKRTKKLVKELYELCFGEDN